MGCYSNYYNRCSYPCNSWSTRPWGYYGNCGYNYNGCGLYGNYGVCGYGYNSCYPNYYNNCGPCGYGYVNGYGYGCGYC